MSVHLLRHGTRTCRLTGFRLATSRRPFAAQALQALAEQPSHASTSEPTTPSQPIPTQPSQTTPQAIYPPKESPRRKRVAKQKSSRAAKEDSNGSPRSPLQPNRIDLYLTSLTAAGVEPQLSDVEKCRPASHPDTHRPEYAKAYNTLVDTLCRSFSKQQLRRFIRSYGLDPFFSRANRKKIEYAETIIEEQWQWPSLAAVEKAQRDRTEVTVESFRVTPSQLFLILGRDGADLLQLTMKYNVHISLLPDPLSLRVEGLRGNIRALGKRVHELKKDIVEETFQLPTHAPIQPELMQRISRLAGAFIENIGSEGLIRLCAKSSRELNGAKRLATRAITEYHVATHTPLLSYLPVGVPSLTATPPVLFPHSYSLYPFLSPQSLPWYMSTAASFRVRRVSEWLINTSSEDIASTGGLAAGNGRILTVDRESVDLKDVLFKGATTSSTASDGSRRTIKVSLGHILFTSPTGNRTTLVPPLKGPYQFASILEWIHNHKPRTAFVASLPAVLISTQPSEQRLVYRLVYKALPLPSAKPVTERSDTGPEVALPTTETLNLEVVLQKLDEGSKDSADATSDAPSLLLTPRCWRSTEADLDLMLPDRSIDMRFSVLDTTEIPSGREPEDLQTYVSALRTFLTSSEDVQQPDAPLLLYRNGHTFVLHSSATIRQNVERLEGQNPDDAAGSATQVVSESVFDLESTERIKRCEITCSDPTSDDAWTEFLKQCDLLSGTNYRPLGSLSLTNEDAEVL